MVCQINGANKPWGCLCLCQWTTKFATLLNERHSTPKEMRSAEIGAYLTSFYDESWVMIFEQKHEVKVEKCVSSFLTSLQGHSQISRHGMGRTCPRSLHSRWIMFQIQEWPMQLDKIRMVKFSLATISRLWVCKTYQGAKINISMHAKQESTRQRDLWGDT